MHHNKDDFGMQVEPGRSFSCAVCVSFNPASNDVEAGEAGAGRVNRRTWHHTNPHNCQLGSFVQCKFTRLVKLVQLVQLVQVNIFSSTFLLQYSNDLLSSSLTVQYSFERMLFV